MRLLTLIIAALALSSSTHMLEARGQKSSDVGQASVRLSLSDDELEMVVRLYEWALSVSFTTGERATFRRYFVSSWERNERGAATLLRLAKKVSTMDEAERKAAQPDFRKAFLADINSAPESPVNSFLLGVYRRTLGDDPTAQSGGGAEAQDSEAGTAAEGAEPAARGGGQPAESVGETRESFRPATSPVRLSELIGRWEKGRVSAYCYRDVATNYYRSGYGSAQQHEVRADGGFDYSNYATVSLYNCKTELFTAMKGRVTVSGNQVTFTYLSGTVKGKDSCKATGFDKPAQMQARTFVVEREGERIRLCEMGAETPTCLYKAK
jgi:hypothetical protein